MRKTLLTATLLAGLPLTGALAGAVSIGLQQTGVNAGAITTEATGAGTATMGSTNYGSFTVNQATAQDQAVLTGLGVLNSQTLNISSNTAGTLNVWVSSTGLTRDTGQTGFVSSFAVNTLALGITNVTEQTFWCTGAAYCTTNSIDMASFTAIGTVGPAFTAGAPAATYTATEEYTITATGVGNDNITIDLTAAVPEPASLALLGVGMLGVGFVARRKRSV